MKRFALMAAGAVLVAACQSETEPARTTGPVEPANAAEATLSGEACPDIGDRAYFFWMQPRSAEPGDKIALFPYWTDMPGAYNDLPPGCLDDLGVYPEGAATFSREEDGLAIATISEDVEAGTRVRLDGTYRGHGLSGQVEVFRAADNPLVGTWRQDGENCPANSAIQELVFTGGGDFSVTWTPFEVYKDYWGTYTYDAETGAIHLDVESGNQIPEDIVPDGTVVLSDDALSFETLSFGTPRQAEGVCMGSFPK